MLVRACLQDTSSACIVSLGCLASGCVGGSGFAARAFLVWPARTETRTRDFSLAPGSPGSTGLDLLKGAKNWRKTGCGAADGGEQNCTVRDADAIRPGPNGKGDEGGTRDDSVC